MIIRKSEQLSSQYIIRCLSDILRLNSPFADDFGLYYGRAGISLCLFEVSQFLHDDEIENAALKTLEYSLACDIRDISFSKGIMGICFLLSYLVRYNFIDKISLDSYAEKHEYMLSKMDKVNFEEMNIFQLSNYFGMNLYSNYPSNGMDSSVLKLNEACCNAFKIIWDNYLHGQKGLNVELSLKVWKEWLYYLTRNKKLRLPQDTSAIYSFCQLQDEGLLKTDNCTMRYISELSLLLRDCKLKVQIDRLQKNVYSLSGLPMITSQLLEICTFPLLQDKVIHRMVSKELDIQSTDELKDRLNYLLINSSSKMSLYDGLSRLILIYLNINSADAHERLKDLF